MESNIKGEEAVELFKLIKAKGMLPTKLNDLVPLSFIGQAAVTFYRQTIKAMDMLKMTEEQRKATLRDGQDAGEMLLDIETRIGELLASKPISPIRSKSGRLEGTQKRIPEELPYKRSEQAQAIAKHPEIVERVKAQARENEDIPTKTAVLNEIQHEKERAWQQKAAQMKGKTKAEISIEETLYISHLEKFITNTPKVPKQWSEKGFKMASGLAKIIIKRMEVFTDGKKAENISNGRVRLTA